MALLEVSRLVLALVLSYEVSHSFRALLQDKIGKCGLLVVPLVSSHILRCMTCDLCSYIRGWYLLGLEVERLGCEDQEA